MDQHGGNIYQFCRKMYDFSANLHPDGLPDEIKQAMADSLGECEAYPDPKQRKLRAALASFHQIEEERIAIGNGADDLIYRICLAFRPRRALVVAPTFTEYAKALRTAGCEVEHLILREEDGFQVTESVVEEIRKRQCDMVFLCNPNNPTGIPIPRRQVMSLVHATIQGGARVVLDECFMEFVLGQEEYSILSDIKKLPGVIILKSFTKLFAMAGVRLGYCLCGDVEDASSIAGCLQTWPVGTLAQAAGVAALSLVDRFESTCVYVALERERLTGALIDAGFKTYGSQANYIFFRGPIGLSEKFLKHDVMIRNCANYEGLTEGYYRIAVRDRKENDYFIDVLKTIQI